MRSVLTKGGYYARRPEPPIAAADPFEVYAERIKALGFSMREAEILLHTLHFASRLPKRPEPDDVIDLAPLAALEITTIWAG